MNRAILTVIFLILGYTFSLYQQTAQIVKDINPNGSSWPENLTAVDASFQGEPFSGLFFTADDGIHGRELWRTNGTQEGTFMIKDINPYGHSSPQDLTLVHTNSDSKIFFTAAEEGSNRTLWISDGTEEGTRIVYKNGLYSAPYSRSLVSFREQVFFVAFNPDFGKEIWISDGTPEGTHIFEDIIPGPGSSDPSELRKVGNKLFFSAYDGINGLSLYCTDGTPKGTHRIKSLHTGLPSGAYEGARHFFEFNEKIYFSVNRGFYGQLWVTDGTTEGTYKLWQREDGNDARINAFVAFKDKLYFKTYEFGIYRTDGTIEGTEKFPSFQGSIWEFTNTPLLVYEDRLYFSMYQWENGIELWSTDGTNEGTRLLKDINPGGPNSHIFNMNLMENKIWFLAEDESRIQVWVSDGSFNGTQKVSNLAYEGNSFSSWDRMAVVGGNLYFAPAMGAVEGELWKINGLLSSNSEIPAKLNDFTCWPNPASEDLYLNIDIPQTILILDLQGRILKKENLNTSKKISLNGLTPGIYFVTNQTRTKVEKLVVQ